MRNSGLITIHFQTSGCFLEDIFRQSAEDCSGGAQTKVLHFVENVHVIKDNMFPVPSLFKLIQEESGTSWCEMYKVFNMGHRFEIYTSPSVAEDIIAISKSFNIDARIVGKVEPYEGKKLTIKSDKGEFFY